jgi:CHAT domain-containing protein
MKNCLLIFLAAHLFSGCTLQPQEVQPTAMSSRAGRQQKFAPNAVSRSQAIAAGQTMEFVAAMEATAADAEMKQQLLEASHAYLQAGHASIQLGQFQRAISYATKTVEFGHRANSPLEAYGMLALADIYTRLLQHQKSREWLDKAIPVISRLTGEAKDLAEANLYRQLGQNYFGLGDRELAIKYLESAVAAWDRRMNFLKSSAAAKRSNLNFVIQTAEDATVVALHRLGTAYLRTGKPEKGAEAFERGISILAAAKLKSSMESSLLAGLGEAYVAQKEFPRAMENLKRAIEMAETRRQSAQLQTASGSMGKLLLDTKRPSDALSYYQKAVDSIESTRSLLESEDSRTSFFSNKEPPYHGIMLAHLRTKNVEESFNYNERARSRAFLDVLGSKVQLAARGKFAEEEKTLQEQITMLRAQLGNQRGTEDGEGETDSGGLTQKLQIAQKAYDAFLAKLRKENREQASLINVEPLKLKRFQELLDPGVTVLEYFVPRRGRAMLWALDKQRLRFVEIRINRANLVTKVTALRETISQLGEPEKLNQESQELYKILIQPALPHIAGKGLLIIPHDVLHYLPFQALRAPDGQYLIEKYPINYLSSASLMQFTQEKRKARGELNSILAQSGKVLALGNPDLGDSKMSLQFAGIETKEIKSLYPQSSIYLEKEASEERAKILASQSDIIHFASHAELNEHDPLASAILLAKSDKEDGRLEVREIFGMDLKASLVVLSACETGLGKLSTGDELVGLTRAFIYAGTPSVIASLWNVEDSSTAQLMASFYKNLKTMTKVEALRQAQLQLITGKVNSELLARRGIGGVGKLGEAAKAKPSAEAVSSATSVSNSISTSHPYFWAPFILVGEGK